MDYDQKIAQQIDQYKDVDQMHRQELIREYYTQKYVIPHWMKVFAPAHNHFLFYADQLAESLTKTGIPYIASVGSGDGALEVVVGQKLRDAGVDFTFELLELSLYQQERAEKNVAEAGLKGHFILTQADLNSWVPAKEYAAIMAHHSLHHILNLEGLFDAIRGCLKGTFCTMDMIGRNGHMHWPEVLELVELFWDIIPAEKRRHAVLHDFEKGFRNHDCSTEGFEGIRAQDILPCLIPRFGFRAFFTSGGLIDTFVGPGFGRHYDPQKQWDRAFIDLVAVLNEILIDTGYVKPTQMHAIMTMDLEETPKVHKNRTPQFCLRRA